MKSEESASDARKRKSWRGHDHQRTMHRVPSQEELADADNAGPLPGKQACSRLYNYEEIPDYLKHNQYLVNGYRVNLSVLQCIRSMFDIHNETCNIWSHLLGAVIFIIVGICTVSSFENPHVEDFVVNGIYMGCAVVLMLNSTIFHIFNCCSQEVYCWTARLDYSGISLMITGSFYPPMYYAFKCNPNWRIFYLTIISIVGVAGLILGLLPVAAAPRFRVLRAVYGLTFGWISLVPVFHLLYLLGFEVVWGPGKWMLLMGVLYTIGALFYASLVPERWYPGKYDYGLSSHVIWHFFIVAAALVHLYACLEAFKLNRALTCEMLESRWYTHATA